MRSVRFTAKEAEMIEDCIAEATHGSPTPVTAKIVAKLQAAREPAPTGVSASALERILIEAARGRVVPLAGATGAVWARVSRMATSVGATEDSARELGSWIARQGWMRNTLTVMDILARHWTNWLSKARAEAPPPGLPEGLDGTKTKADVGQDPAQPNRGTSSRRRAEGLG